MRLLLGKRVRNGKVWQQLGLATISKRVAGNRDFGEMRVVLLQEMPRVPYKRLVQCDCDIWNRPQSLASLRSLMLAAWQ